MEEGERDGDGELSKKEGNNREWREMSEQGRGMAKGGIEKIEEGGPKKKKKELKGKVGKGRERKRRRSGWNQKER